MDTRPLRSIDQSGLQADLRQFGAIGASTWIRSTQLTEQTYLGNGFPFNGSRLAFVFSSGFGFFDSFALSLTNQVPFKFSDCTEYLHH